MSEYRIVCVGQQGESFNMLLDGLGPDTLAKIADVLIGETIDTYGRKTKVKEAFVQTKPTPEWERWK